ncbi:arsenate reductase (glutaredoxin) [Xanthobacter autotrophicus DSM 431]|uniref:arsenate reductase (glutaredoxin) n=1 Tax=Xanthobacter nonsaccharivorans TaxID=3119912 RepID=UPI0037280D1A
MSRSQKVTIWHNPACGTSRNVLAAIRAKGIEPEVVLYLKTPPGRADIARAVKAAGLTVRGAMRDKGGPFEELGLGAPGVSDDALLDAMAAHPVLINRPFVFTGRGVRLCRPADVLGEIFP